MNFEVDNKKIEIFYNESNQAKLPIVLLLRFLPSIHTYYLFNIAFACSYNDSSRNTGCAPFVISSETGEPLK